MNAQTIAPRKSGARKAESRFQRLWAEAEALEKENLELETDLEALVKRIDSEIFLAEKKLGRVIYDAVHRQLDFSQKKSLLKWQRSELSEWIDENLSELSAMGMVDETLMNRLAILRAAELDLEIDPDSPLSPTEQLDKYFEEDAAEYRKQREAEEAFDESAEQADGFDVDPDDMQESMDDEDLAEIFRRVREQFEEDQESAGTEPPDLQRKDISDAVFKRLFRQTATALHPDKESNEQKRQEKHELMSQLLKARKEYDLITILRLHEEYATAESELNITDQQELEGILVQYLSQQRERMDEIVHKSPIHQMAFTQFYDKHSATVTRRIKAHIKKIDKKKEGLLIFNEKVTTLKLLKEILAARYDASMLRDRW